MLATLQVQKAIYETLVWYGFEVHDTLPINTKLPYVQISNIQVYDKSDKTDKRQQYIVSLAVWCIDTESININMMLEKVLDLVDEELLLDDGYIHDKTTLDYLTIIKEDYHGETLNHGVVQLNIEVSDNK